MMAATLALAVGGTGCSKDKESLILLTVSAEDGYTTGLRTLVVACGTISQVFRLPTAISTSPISVGLYVPSSVTGSQEVTAYATGSACGPGYSGTTTVHIAEAGVTAPGTIVMLEATTCPPNGSTGSGGSSGTGGSGPPACASSAPPPAGTPPQLKCCAEYDQDTPEVCGASGTEIDATAFSPDGHTLVTAAVLTDSSDNLTGNDVKVWSFDGHTLSPVAVLQSDGWLGLAFSPDGTQLAVPVQGGVDLWSTADWTNDNVLAGSSNFFGGVGFTPDSKEVVAIDRVSGGGSLYLFDLTGAEPGIPVAIVTLPAEPDSVAVAPKAVGGQLGVAVAYTDGTMGVFSLANGTFSAATNLTVDVGGNSIWNPAFSPDGTLLAVSDDASTIHFWAFPVPATLAESGGEIAFSTADDADIAFGLAFSPNGSYLVGGGGDMFDFSDPRVGIFNVATRASYASAALSYAPTSVAFSPSGNAVAGGEIDCGRVFVCTN
ncbi:MAG TPA: WD40 repeat domain-containing protein [Polyangia bacterium]|nr:WD40 repeat domain-containing protein [Polyangia bacterium]